MKLKEFGYIPTGAPVTGGTVSHEADRYFVSVTGNRPDTHQPPQPKAHGQGVDMGRKDLALTSDGEVFKNVNNTSTVRKLEKKLRREQRALARKLAHPKKRGEKSATKRGKNRLFRTFGERFSCFCKIMPKFIVIPEAFCSPSP